MAFDLTTSNEAQAAATPPYPRCIAVDFDGTLFVTDFPHIVEPKWDVINRAKAEQAKGTVLILWTCRHGEHLEDALQSLSGSLSLAATDVKSVRTNTGMTVLSVLHKKGETHESERIYRCF